jgi:hypothetical protein
MDRFRSRPLPSDKPRSVKIGCGSLRQMAPCDTVDLSQARTLGGVRALGPPAGPRPPPFAGRQAWILHTALSTGDVRRPAAK